MRKSLLHFLSVFTLLLFGLSARAQDGVVDLGTLVADVEYDIPQYVVVKAQYTPSVTGPVKMVWTGNPLTLYTSPDATEASTVGGSHAYNNGNQVMSYRELKANTTYYFNQYCMQGGKLTIREGDIPIEVVSVEPRASEDHPFSVSTNYRIYVTFNYPVTIGNTYLVVDGERTQIYPVISNTSVCCDVYNEIMYLYREGKLKEGSTLTLRIMQVKDALNDQNRYNSNGRCEVNFTMAAKPAEVVETHGFTVKSIDNEMRSYYFPDDPDGLFSLTFDTPIDPARTPIASMTFGNPDNIDLGVYTESLPGSVDGNKVTFDFTGKLRRTIDMLPAADATTMPSDIYVSFGGIYTPDGQRAYTDVMSNPNGFAVSMKVIDLQYNVAADFAPARGSLLKPGTEMEVWVMNGELVAYDSFCIDYTEGGELKTLTIPADAVREEADEFSATGLDKLYYFTVPEYSADDDSQVFVYMKNLTCADGLDHSADVRGDFKPSTAGISDILGDNHDDTTGDIYDITGRCILRGATLRELRSLDKGVYIFNGKKYIR